MFYVPEASTPYPAESVGRVLGLFARLLGNAHERLPSIIKALRLDPVMETRVGNLSKGYRRRLLIALGLLAPQRSDLLVVMERKNLPPEAGFREGAIDAGSLRAGLE